MFDRLKKEGLPSNPDLSSVLSFGNIRFPEDPSLLDYGSTDPRGVSRVEYPYGPYYVFSTT